MYTDVKDKGRKFVYKVSNLINKHIKIMYYATTLTKIIQLKWLFSIFSVSTPFYNCIMSSINNIYLNFTKIKLSNTSITLLKP